MKVESQYDNFFNLSNMPLIFAVIIVFILAEKCSFIPAVLARKLVHFSSGLLLVSVQIDSVTYAFIFCFALLVSLSNCFTSAFRFTKQRDIGIQLYSLVVMFWTWSNLPFILLSPMFFADPLAAVFGQYIRTPKLYKSKTVLGSLIFFLTSCFLSSGYDNNLVSIFLWSSVMTVTELLSGAWDNLFLAVVIYLQYISIS